MTEQEKTYFSRITLAIDYISKHFREQPSLDEIAAHVSLSPFHFQRLFTEWAGVSPKKFLQYISLGHAKKLLDAGKTSLFETALDTGLSGTGRLHDLFISIEGMTPGEYKNGAQNLQLNYSFADTPFGTVIIASTPKGICHMAFADEDTEAVDTLKARFPNATYRQLTDQLQQDALGIFSSDWKRPASVKLHLKGSSFQLKVWETLLKIPAGKLATYGSIAAHLDSPGASRAVGTAVGDNPVAVLIPCHRVIRASGAFGEYHWGSARKIAMIGWEAARAENMAELSYRY